MITSSFFPCVGCGIGFFSFFLFNCIIELKLGRANQLCHSSIKFYITLTFSKGLSFLSLGGCEGWREGFVCEVCSSLECNTGQWRLRQQVSQNFGRWFYNSSRNLGGLKEERHVEGAEICLFRVQRSHFCCAFIMRGWGGAKGVLLLVHTETSTLTSPRDQRGTRCKDQLAAH